MFKTSGILFGLIIVLFSSNLYAKGPIPKDTGLALDSMVPEISVIDVNNDKQTIRQLSGDKGLILILFRSADWCPYCKKHLIEINKWHSKFTALGYGIAAISYDSVETLKTFSDKRKLLYPLLADQNHQTMIDYKVLNKKYQPGDDDYGIPYPGVLIIDEQGKLTYKYFYKGYKKRVKLKKLYQRLSEQK